MVIKLFLRSQFGNSLHKTHKRPLPPDHVTDPPPPSITPKPQRSGTQPGRLHNQTLLPNAKSQGTKNIGPPSSGQKPPKPETRNSSHPRSRTCRNLNPTALNTKTRWKKTMIYTQFALETHSKLISPKAQNHADAFLLWPHPKQQTQKFPHISNKQQRKSPSQAPRATSPLKKSPAPVTRHLMGPQSWNTKTKNQAPSAQSGKAISKQEKSNTWLKKQNS